MHVCYASRYRLWGHDLGFKYLCLGPGPGVRTDLCSALFLSVSLVVTWTWGSPGEFGVVPKLGSQMDFEATNSQIIVLNATTLSCIQKSFQGTLPS